MARSARSMQQIDITYKNCIDSPPESPGSMITGANSAKLSNSRFAVYNCDYRLRNQMILFGESRLEITGDLIPH